MGGCVLTPKSCVGAKLRSSVVEKTSGLYFSYEVNLTLGLNQGFFGTITCWKLLSIIRVYDVIMSIKEIKEQMRKDRNFMDASGNICKTPILWSPRKGSDRYSA